MDAVCIPYIFTHPPNRFGMFNQPAAKSALNTLGLFCCFTYMGVEAHLEGVSQFDELVAGDQGIEHQRAGESHAIP